MRLEKDFYIYEWTSAYDNNCNTYVISGDVTVLIDPGHSKFLDSLFSQMDEDGLSPDRIDVMIATHSHPDHIEGIGAFLEKPVKIAISQEEERYLLDSMGQSPPRFRVDFYLKEGTLHLGEKRFEILLTPGHSPGSLSVYWPARKALFTGDVLFCRGIGRTDFQEGDSKALRESIERLSRLDAEIVLPGHGQIMIGRERVLENFEMIRQNFYPYL